MARILSKEGARPRVSGFFFKAVVQLLLLLGMETWVVTPRIGTGLWGFPRTGGMKTDGEAATAEFRW